MPLEVCLHITPAKPRDEWLSHQSRRALHKQAEHVR